jgi:predicted TIM-barrel fold metal-dependent hydrolase
MFVAGRLPPVGFEPGGRLRGHFSSIKEKTMSTAHRIDVHTHLIPPFYAEELKSHGGDPSGWGSPEWSPEQAISFMDDEGIAVAMLSLTAPGIDGWRVGEERTAIARRVNDYGASLVQERPDRFGYLATLALPDVDSALKEIDRAYDQLKIDGVVLHSNYGGIYLADPAFEPVWEELNRRSAVVFIHPTTPHLVKVLPKDPGPIEDYPAETTRTAFYLVIAGHLTRYSSMKIILSHGGGFLPYAATRFAELKSSLDPEHTVEELTATMKSFYFDTALSAPSGLPSLLAFAPRGHVVFGTDYPYASEAVSKKFTRNMDNYDQFKTGELDEINRGARTLFPRLLRQT